MVGGGGGRGPERIGCSRLDEGSTTRGAEYGVESTRLTKNHVETMDSSDIGRE